MSKKFTIITVVKNNAVNICCTIESVLFQKFKNYALQVNPKLQFFEVSATKGDGMEAWYGWLKVQSKKV